MAPKRKGNKYDIYDTYVIGYLNNSDIIFMVDMEDYEKIKPYTWMLHHNQVCSHIDRKCVSLARYILDFTDSNKKVLRINNTIHDYRKSNLFTGNKYEDCGDYYKGYCYDSQYFLIDKDDYELVKDYTWHIDSNGYVITKYKKEIIKQHRLIMHLDKNDIREIDHVHHNTFDNRKSELRITSHSQNCINTRLASNNTSGTKGVYLLPSGKWAAQITYENNKIYLGSFNNIDLATCARKNAESLYHGEYVCQE